MCVATCDAFFFKGDDNICEPCDVCPNGKWAATACSTASDAICSDWTQCPVGTEQDTIPTNVTDRTCKGCASGFYQDEAGKIACKPVTVCRMPNIEDSPPSTTADRVCKCNEVMCKARLDDLFGDLLCREMTSDEHTTFMGACCAGATQQEQHNAVTAMNDYIERHNCEGCTSTCECTRGFTKFDYLITVVNVTNDVFDENGTVTGQATQFAQANGTICRQCPANSFVSLDGDNTCRPVTECIAGTQELRAPTPASDRVCEPCPAGSTDNDSDGATSCVACARGTSYMPQQGKIGACLPATNCPAGKDQLLDATLIDDRICDACDDGKFKATVGQEACRAYTVCDSAQYMEQAPTVIGDTVCANITICEEDEYESTPPSANSNAVCSPLSR